MKDRRLDFCVRGELQMSTQAALKPPNASSNPFTCTCTFAKTRARKRGQTLLCTAGTALHGDLQHSSVLTFLIQPTTLDLELEIKRLLRIQYLETREDFARHGRGLPLHNPWFKFESSVPIP